jgi:hypothetical protein
MDSKRTGALRWWLGAAVAAGLGVAALLDLRAPPSITTGAAPEPERVPAPLAPPRIAAPAARDPEPPPEAVRRAAAPAAEARSSPAQTPLREAWKTALAGSQSNAPTARIVPGVTRTAGGTIVDPPYQQLAEQAQLTSDQLDALGMALRDERARIGALRAEPLTSAELRAQSDAIRRQTETRLENVLDAKQFAALRVLRQHLENPPATPIRGR